MATVLLEVRVDDEVALALYSDGMVLAPSDQDKEEVRGRLVEALAIITPWEPRGEVVASVRILPSRERKLRLHRVTSEQGGDVA